MYSGFICFKAIIVSLTEKLLTALKHFPGRTKVPHSQLDPALGNQSNFPPLTIVPL